MPYCEPHRTSRAKIVDLEVMRLELRRTARPPGRRAGEERGTILYFPRQHRPTLRLGLL